MKKYILTESQVKKVVDSLIQEQTDDASLAAQVQCFLNQVMGSNLKITGRMDGMTKKQLIMFQQMKRKAGANIVADGDWKYRTQSTLTPEEAKIWKKCVRKYGTGV